MWYLSNMMNRNPILSLSSLVSKYDDFFLYNTPSMQDLNSHTHKCCKKDWKGNNSWKNNDDYGVQKSLWIIRTKKQSMTEFGPIYLWDFIIVFQSLGKKK